MIENIDASLKRGWEKFGRTLGKHWKKVGIRFEQFWDEFGKIYLNFDKKI